MLVSDAKAQRQREGEEPGVSCLWVCVDCVSVLGWCCSGKEGTCIFAIKLLPMLSHRGRNRRTECVIIRGRRDEARMSLTNDSSAIFCLVFFKIS